MLSHDFFQVRAERIERQFFIQSRVLSGGNVDSSFSVASRNVASESVDSKPKFRPDLVGDFLHKKRPGVNFIKLKKLKNKAFVPGKPFQPSLMFGQELTLEWST